MNIAVTGWRGNLAHELIEQGCIPVKSNILDEDSIRAELKNIRPEVLINCAAINMPKALKDEKLTYQVNARGPSMLLRAFSGKIIHISTDYVFDGQRGNYDELDEPNPINYYGMTKWGGEIFCNLFGDNRCCVVRTSLLYGGYQRKDLVTTVLDKLTAEEPILMAATLQSKPTYIPHLAEALIKLAHFEKFPRILHISGRDCVSRYQFAKEVACVWKLPNLAVPSDPFDSAVRRPPNSSLNCQDAEDLGLPLYSLFKGLVAYNAAY